MRYIIAVIIPCVPFFRQREISKGVTCVVLQAIIIGWFPAAIWAITEIKVTETSNHFKKLRDELK